MSYISKPPCAAELIADCDRAAEAAHVRLGCTEPALLRARQLGIRDAIIKTLCADIAELTRANEPPMTKAERLIGEALEVIATFSGHPVAGDDADDVHNKLSDLLGELRAVQFVALTEEESSR